MISSEKLLQKIFFASLIIWRLLMVYWAFYTFNIHKGVCRNACNVLSFILGGLVVPLGLFLCFLVTDLPQVFLYTWVIYSIVVAFANLKPWRKLCCCCECKRNYPTATKFIQGFSPHFHCFGRSFWHFHIAAHHKQIVDARKLP